MDLEGIMSDMAVSYFHDSDRAECFLEISDFVYASVDESCVPDDDTELIDMAQESANEGLCDEIDTRDIRRSLESASYYSVTSRCIAYIHECFEEDGLDSYDKSDIDIVSRNRVQRMKVAREWVDDGVTALYSDDPCHDFIFVKHHENINIYQDVTEEHENDSIMIMSISLGERDEDSESSGAEDVEPKAQQERGCQSS